MNLMKLLKSAAIPLAALSLAPLSCLAQSDQGTVFEVVSLVLKPGMTAKFEQGMKQVSAYAQSHGDTTGATAFQVMFGPNDGNIVFLIPFKWENVDHPPSYEAGLGQVISKNIDPYVSSSHTSLIRLMPKLGNPAQANGTPEKFYEVLDLKIKPGRGADFIAAVTQLTEAEQKYNPGPGPVEVYEEVSGGDADDVTVAIGHPNFADFGKPEKSDTEVLTQAFGAAAARSIINELESTIVSEENFFVRYRPDISYIPSGQGQ
jgi:hypothetical protein